MNDDLTGVSATSLLNLLASTSQQIEFFTSSIVNEVKDGNESPLRVLIQLRAMEKASKAILEQIRDEINTAAEKYPGKDFELWGNKIEKAEVGITYDYSVCKDVEFERLEVDFNTAKSRLDERTKWLRALKKPLNIINEDGESDTIYPPEKKSTPFVKVTIR